MDHEFIHRAVIDSGGVIVGGYMRSWVSSGEPSDKGWGDLDVYGVELQKASKLAEQIKEVTGKIVDFKYIGAVTDFYCNSWVYDGSSIYREKTRDGDADDLDVLEQTKAKMAVLISENAFGTYATKRAILKYMRKYNFTIHNPDKTMFDFSEIHTMLFKYINEFQSIPTKYSEAEQKMVDFALRDIKKFLA